MILTWVVYKNIKMPNRKIGSMPAKITPQRSKGRQKKEKPALKTPTVLKVKIPPVKAISADTEKQKADQSKFTKNDIKVVLANEVIRAQFPKKLTVTKKPIKKIQNNKTNKRTISKNIILNRKHVLRNTITVTEEKNTEECINKEAVKTRQPKILTTQINLKLSDNEPSKNPVENIVVSPKPVKKEISKPVKLRRRKATVQGAVASGDANVSPENKDPPTIPKIVAKRKLSMKTKPGPLTRRRKVNDGIEDVKEEILTHDITQEEKEVPIVEPKDLLTLRCSSASELSWTKDISSSSTTTCVTVSSRDFFRIDKKLPLVKLSNIDCKLKYCDKMCLSVSDSVCAEKNDSEIENKCESLIDIPCPLNLSTSSTCDTSSQGVQSSKKASKLSETLKKLSSKLKNFDLDVINWIGGTDEETNSEFDFLNDKTIRGGFLKEEKDIIFTCKEINRILSGDTVTNEGEGDDVRISNELVINKDLENDDSRKVISTETDKDINVTNKQNFSEDNDDDDALSLFAESITGIESSRRNSAVAATLDLPAVEEYVPEPVFKDTFISPEITYRPSRIASKDTTDAQDYSIINANYCEKQNADSTSVYKENSTFNHIIYEDSVGDFSKNLAQYNSSDIQRNSSSPRMMASIHKPKQGIHSCVFRGVCFFYLISSCKKTICKFPHSFIEIEDVKKKLSLISEHLFVAEYMMVRTWPQLRRKYGKCFVEECINRELSRFVVEMAIDFIVKSTDKSRDDNNLKTNIVETILLYLNKVDLSTCADLLNYKVQNFTGLLLCDFFMKTIAESQNFSQFKAVFINLTEFMCNIKRIFDKNVATLILERLSILPYDEGLARALIKIIKNTDVGILSNPMIGNLEMQLMSSNLGLYDELVGLHKKTNTNHTVPANCYDKMANESTASIQINNNLIPNSDIRYSPDTTNLDNVNKCVEPVITRTIDFKKIQPHLNDKMKKSILEGPKNNYNSWMNRTVFDNIKFKRASQPKWPGYKRRLNRNSETRPSKYQRQDGPSFSQDFL